MPSKRVRFTYPPDLVHQPVVYDMGKQFLVTTNIRRASLDHDRGWAIIEITGAEADIDQALDWARGQGVHVEFAES